MRLRYGVNPQDWEATLSSVGKEMPIRILAGEPSYINVLDALNGWMLVSEARSALGRPVAASFKHVSPAGVAVAGELPNVTMALYKSGIPRLSDVSSAYIRARMCDPRSSYGDIIALSDEVDQSLAEAIAPLVSDGVVAPSFAPGTVQTLARKKRGGFLVIEADPGFVPPVSEVREIFGVRLTQKREHAGVSEGELYSRFESANRGSLEDALLGLASVRYTQSNSVAYVSGGQVAGIGAGQQSRIDCSVLAGLKFDRWRLLSHPKVASLRFRDSATIAERVNLIYKLIERGNSMADSSELDKLLIGEVPTLTAEERASWLLGAPGATFVSDGFIPFGDNIDELSHHGVHHVVAPRGSIRDDEVLAACELHGMSLSYTERRYFHH